MRSFRTGIVTTTFKGGGVAAKACDGKNTARQHPAAQTILNAIRISANMGGDGSIGVP
ncbi:hypothetical protein NITLEN_11107 [Nitrospira lenta]|uniref:Uncharacterized protein n=1 Tax=Nitrospira lenta TaxID=1436998 RepID=A0A330L2M6_9BACT|nr:hypothetical protein NITLEN_11107 [Nitrospira lenta]